MATSAIDPNLFAQILNIDSQNLSASNLRSKGLDPSYSLDNNFVLTKPVEANTQVAATGNRLPNILDTARDMGGKISVQQIDKIEEQTQELRNKFKTIAAELDQSQNFDPRESLIQQLEMRQNDIENRLNEAIQARLGIFQDAAPTSEVVSSISGSENLTTPLTKFMGLITHGEKQLFAIEQELTDIAKTSQSMTFSPADMLRLQLKMCHVTQQLELFTSMLNKGLESSKTVFNTQI